MRMPFVVEMEENELSLGRVLHDLHAQRCVVSMALAGFEVHKDADIRTSSFIGETTPKSEKNDTSKKCGSRTTYTYTTIMGQVNGEDEPPDHIGKIIGTLKWFLRMPQIPTNGAAYALLFMYTSEAIRNKVKESTENTVQKIFFDGCKDAAFQLPSFEDRYDIAMFGKLGPEKTADVSAKLLPGYVIDEWRNYKSVVNYAKFISAPRAPKQKTNVPSFKYKNIHNRENRSSISGARTFNT